VTGFVRPTREANWAQSNLSGWQKRSPSNKTINPADSNRIPLKPTHPQCRCEVDIFLALPYFLRSSLTAEIAEPADSVAPATELLSDFSMVQQSPLEATHGEFTRTD